MTVLLEATLAEERDQEPLWHGLDTPAARGPADAPRTLDDVLSETWDGLLAGAPVACPVCHGEMAARWSAGAGVVGGRCANCGSALA